MSDAEAVEPKQTTAAGESIPVPTRADVMEAFRKVAGSAVVPPSEDDDTTDTVH